MSQPQEITDIPQESIISSTLNEGGYNYTVPASVPIEVEQMNIEVTATAQYSSGHHHANQLINQSENINHFRSNDPIQYVVPHSNQQEQQQPNTLLETEGVEQQHNHSLKLREQDIQVNNSDLHQTNYAQIDEEISSNKQSDQIQSGFYSNQQGAHVGEVSQQGSAYQFQQSQLQQQHQQQQQVFPQQQQEPLRMLSPEELNHIFIEFKAAITNSQVDKVQSILQKYQKIHDLANKIDPQTKQISTYIAVNLQTDEETYAMLKVLIDNGAKALFKDQLNQSVLFYVAKDGKMKSFGLLMEHGCDANEADTNGQTPLFFAARDNQIEMVKELIARGADAYHIDKLYSQTALFYAARNGHNEIINILIYAGCKVNHFDTMRKQAKSFAAKFASKETANLLQEHMNRAKNEELKAKEALSKKSKQVLKEVTTSNTPITQSTDQQNQSTNALTAVDSLNSENKGAPLSQQDSKKTDPKGRNRKSIKDQAKMTYKLVYTDENGQQRELTLAEYSEFKVKYPEITRIMENADEMINEDVYGKEKDSWEKIAKKILQSIWKVKGCYLFQAPVDVERYKIDDYYDIVQKPMDFGTIKNKLNNNVYGNCKEFLEDCELVFYNCILYNGSDCEVGRVCQSVKLEFKKQCLLYDVYQYLSAEQIEQIGGEQQQNGANIEARAQAIAAMQTQQVINNNNHLRSTFPNRSIEEFSSQVAQIPQQYSESFSQLQQQTQQLPQQLSQPQQMQTLQQVQYQQQQQEENIVTRFNNDHQQQVYNNQMESESNEGIPLQQDQQPIQQLQVQPSEHLQAGFQSQVDESTLNQFQQ